MRRKDREMPHEFALEVLDKCIYATLALTLDDGSPYCIPITIVRDRDALYFHSAMSGLKSDCLTARPRVCLSCVGETRIPPNEFTTEFESAVVFGSVETVEEPAEKRRILKLLCQRHTPDNMHNFNRVIDASLPRTAVWRLSMEQITGKRKKFDSQGVEMKFGRME